MNKLIDSLQKALMPLANKISAIKFLSALGATFQILLPIIMIGSFSCLGAFLNIPAWQSFVTGTGLASVFMTVQSLTLSIITLYIAFVLPYQYATKIGGAPLSSAITTFMTFLLVTPTELYTNIPEKWLGFPGLFTCMIITVIVVRLSKLLVDKGLYIHMPDGVPPMVEESFKAMLPTLIFAVVGITINVLMAKTSFGSIHQVIYTFIQTPLQSFGLSFPAYLFVQVLSTLFMFCGIHGNAIFSIISPLTMNASAENLSALAAGTPLPHIIIDSFSVLCQPGGIGGTFGLAFLMAFAAKSKRMKTLGRLSIVPAIFGINEPLLFGIPIMLNPLLFIPYVLNPIICTSISYISIAVGITPRLTGTTVNWTMPTIISGFLAQGIPTAVLQIILILITTLIWFPFFRLVDRQIVKEESVAAE
ncbi:PTS sugar transporter subunit IIC [Anaerocolumna chitinilytica]|uniref:Permease IIC component n=1 Tax=Anaerocolumna chitinilytica TaxID=1727145 RepID=A0A7I8DJF3_9FIRM|nr:PTS transporter subunit EIIC [Anaerocolumna chitinilytica]BCJ98638.1 permease IIC component [Anaerocolumna chitinilytica]